MSMETNEKDLQETPVTEQEQTAAELPSNELTEEEKREILSVFAETNENKRRRPSFRMTIKNQIILIGCVLVLAGLLLGSYFLFFKEKEPLDAFYAITEETEQVLDGLDTKVTFTFCNRQKNGLSEESDPDFYRIYTYATLYADRTGKIKLSFDEKDAFNGVRVACGSEKEMEIPYKDFYRTRSIDGKTYGFDGESVLTNAILVMTHKEQIKLSVRPLSGFNAEGNDVLVSGGVVMFPMVDRNKISLLEIKNKQSEYLIYRDTDGSFLFKDCELLTYDAESFASLLVDCRYVVTAGTLEQQLDYAVYGLDSEEGLTCEYTLLTTPEKDGSFLFHRVWIGKKAASGSYYYARYFGGRMDSNNTVTESFVNPRVFLIPYSNVEANLCKPVENYFKAPLSSGLSKVEEYYKLDQIKLDYLSEDIHMTVLNLPVLSFSDNISSNSSSASDIIGDKKTYASSKLTYTDWTGETDGAYLVGLVSTDRQPFSVSAAVKNIASDGVYTCVFGLAKDTNNAKYKALLPETVYIRYTTDGINYTKLSEHGLEFTSQQDKTVKEYSFCIQSEQPILKIELTFEMPAEIGYLVMDDLRVFADGADAVPNDALTGLWRMIAPSNMIPDGQTYVYMDSTNFNDFLQQLTALEGDSVVRVGVSSRSEDKGDDVIDTEALAEYGLDQPELHFSYLYDGVVTDLYVSAYNEEGGCRYAYTTMTGDAYGNGNDVVVCNGIIAKVLPSTAEWLDWDPLDFVDHSLVGTYVYEIEQLDVTYNGNSYSFIVKPNGKTLASVLMGDKEMNEQYFRYLYLSMVQLNLKDIYTEQPGDKPEEYLRFRIKSTSDEKEFVFYRVSSSRAYFTVNGDSARYYCLFSSVRKVTDKLEKFVAGQPVER